MAGGEGSAVSLPWGLFFRTDRYPGQLLVPIPKSSARDLLLCYRASASPTRVLHARLLLLNGRGEGTAVMRIQTVQTGIQTGIQTVVKCIQTIQTVKDNQFLFIDLLYRVIPVCMVCMYFTTVCIPVCIPVCTVCMARNYSRLNLGFWTHTAPDFAMLRTGWWK